MDIINRTKNLTDQSLAELDPQISKIIEQEKSRQQSHIELIASENFTYPAIMEAQGSILTNKYAEGYPNKRYYGGCEFVDTIETIAIERAKSLFGADHANVQPHAGSQANAAVYLSVLKPGDKILTMSLSDGGHLTHGHFMNFSGIYHEVVHYGVNETDGLIDYDKIASTAEKEKPKMITVGASAYSRVIDFKKMSEIAQSVGAYLLADIAHIAGLVVSGVHPSPVPYADFVTTTTHKTLRGPRGGLILCKEAHAKKIDSAVFPGTQGGPLMHVIAGKAICFQEAAKDSFKDYQKQVVSNANTLANAMIEKGHFVVSGGTDNHLFMIDLRKKYPELTGKVAQISLDKANITANKNTVPAETRSPFQTSGIRIGTPAVTSRGFIDDDMLLIANAIDIVLQAPEDENSINEAKSIAKELCEKYPLPY
ncbi:MAG: serine hydroxymethyltransferase [Puniceicoccaceae bacterium TMED149]|nr:MAG: serine hydroxymethyltransferase [Puniceicoccaceae bacterium TMED149]|tara:strand:+ start:51 stop:1325 length:1275 start_codon:yes stop_codon:yes gene_type:complete